MIKVIKQNPDIKKSIECNKCKSTLEYLPIDVTSIAQKVYGVGKPFDTWLGCPLCGNKIEVE